MNDQERYLFDLQGFVTVADALDAGQLAALNALVDAHLASDVAPDAANHRFGKLLQWDRLLLDLLDNPRITPYLEALLGRGFRLDHEYLDVIRGVKGPIGHTLHGGATPFDPGQYYHFRDGKFYNGLTVVAYNLHDVNEGDGGFACVPGSHKSHLPFPNEWRDLEAPQPFVRRVTGPAGTAIIFTEAMTHGTLPWHGSHERRTLFFKFSPQMLSWSPRYYNPDDYEDLTERQREILTPPSSYRPKNSSAY